MKFQEGIFEKLQPVALKKTSVIPLYLLNAITFAPCKF